MSERVYNFSAGPATLPVEALEEARENLLSLPGVGMSILEISHRSAAFNAVIEEATENIRRLLELPDGYHPLFLHGGASLQFSMVPMNFLRGRGSADYVVTGSWGTKAVKEAQREGGVRVVWDGKPDNFIRVPTTEEMELSSDAAYLHFTSNETIQGVQFSEVPGDGAVPVVCDCSSDFLSRPIDCSRFDLLYAGAQKNVGPAGVTVAIVHEGLLERIPDDLPTMLDYRTHVSKKSAYNTPPVFPIYMVALVTRWLLRDAGDLQEVARRNEGKAALLYRQIDASGGFYQGHAQASSRSQMNVAWRFADPDLDSRFLEEAAANGLQGLKGHRSVGGLRASIYNAMPRAGVEALAEMMGDFAQRHG